MQRLKIAVVSVMMCISGAWAQKTDAVVPPGDPAPSRKIELLPSVRGEHPRLVFGAKDIERIRKTAESEGKPFYDQLLNYLPGCVPPKDLRFQTDPTEAQRQAFWRLPTVALHYVLTKDPQSLQRATGFLKFFVEQEHWETGEFLDSEMSAGNIMAGAALAYDWLYNDLDPAFRTQVREKLFLQARRMYYGGHLMKVGKTHFWQSDTQNNHRWINNAGLALCILAVADETENSGWLLEKTKEELEFISQWLAPDGSQHESSGYMVFGMPYVVLAFDAADRCLGTNLMAIPYLKNNVAFRLSTMTPGFKDVFHYGDSDGAGWFNSYGFRLAALTRNADEQAALFDFYRANTRVFAYGWASLVWYDPTLSGGSANNLPRYSFFPDLGMACMRDGWRENNIGLMFKCAPYGGATLNALRNSRDFQYINVAHDDPSANMLLLYGRGDNILEDDRYPDGNKMTAAHNTILVNDKGQKGEGQHWTQPLKGADKDMTKMAWVTAYQNNGPITVVEGEASGAYNGLDRYRRTVVWVEGAYVLVLDDIAAPSESDITWLMQSKDIQAGTDGAFKIGPGASQCGLKVISADGVAFESQIGESPAKNRGKSLNFKQIQLTAKTTRWRLASLFDAWNRHPDLTIAKDGQTVRVTISTQNSTDTWLWAQPKGPRSASVLTGRRADGSAFVLRDINTR